MVHEAPLRKTQALRPDLKKDIKMAESERFELSIQVKPVYMISNHAPSAARTTLHIKLRLSDSN